MKGLVSLVFVLIVVYACAGIASTLFSGQYEVSIALAPFELVFADFVSDITLEMAVDYTVYGWEFGSESTFTLDGWSEQEYTVLGRLGAFFLDATIAFDPLIVDTIIYTLASGVTYQTQSITGVTSAGTSAAWTKSIWNCATHDEKITYGLPALSSLQATAQVSLYGVNFEGLFYLKGNDFEAKTVSGKWVYGNPYANWAGVVTQTGSYTASACLPRCGSGWKLTLSGLAGDLRVTSRTYFNLEEYTYNELMTQEKEMTYLKDTFAMGGSYYLPKKDGETCAVRFTREFVTIEGMTLGCAGFDAGLSLTCDGFDWFKVLITDIELAPCVSFDALITFSVTQTCSSKTITLEPNVRFGDTACFTLRLAWDYAGTSTDFSLNALKVNGLSVSYTWNDLSFFSATSFNPVYGSLGGYYLADPVKSPKTYGFFVPDTSFAETTFSTDYTCCAVPGDGYYMQVCYPEEYYDIWEMFAIQATGDGCCGGDYSWEADFYFGDRKVLIADSFWFWYKDEDGNSYEYNKGTPATRTEPVVLGSGTPYCEDDAVTYGVAYYDAPGDSLFGWVKTEVEAVVPIFSSFDVTFGSVVTVYGWEELTLGFSFSW